MKLITKTNRYFIFVISTVLPLSFLLLFFTLEYFVYLKVDEKLRLDEARIVIKIRKDANFISIAPIIDIKAFKKKIKIDKQIHNVQVFDPLVKKMEPFRQLTSLKKIGDTWYLIKIRHSTINNSNLSKAIAVAVFATYLLIFGLLYTLNNRLSLALWEPFYTNITRLKEFSIADKKPIELLVSPIVEFRDLSESIMDLTSKVQNDYKVLTEFTENASHEIQTPLAIILLNLEELMQKDHPASDTKKLYTCYQTAKRLATLNEKLLLLVKIENEQFANFIAVNFNTLVAKKIDEMNQLSKKAKISFKTTDTAPFIVRMDDTLADILITNLISNSIKYTKPKSQVNIHLTKDSLSISNPSISTIDAKKVFDRFAKESTQANSFGLGLNISQKIIDLAKLKVDASNQNDIFTVRIEKEESES